jgi:hypothetical protein
MVDERLRGDERQQGRLGVLGHAVHARALLFRDVIHVITVYARDCVLLLLREQKKSHRESHVPRKSLG